MKWDLLVLWPFSLAAVALTVAVLALTVNDSLLSGFSRRKRQLETFSLRHCAPPSNVKLAAVLVFVLVMLAIVGFKTGTPAPIPWIPACLMVLVALPLFAWLEPPLTHVQRDRQRQIGTYSAWSHYYGYLHIFKNENCVRQRLRQHVRRNPTIRGSMYEDAVVVLWPMDGNYPDTFSDLRGLQARMVEDGQGGEKQDQVQPVGDGTSRTYGNFQIYKAVSADGSAERLVALDKVSALQTLRSMVQYDPTGMAEQDFGQQMQQMLDTMRHIVANRSHLRRRLVLVTYGQDDHVGDLILREINNHAC